MSHDPIIKHRPSAVAPWSATRAGKQSTTSTHALADRLMITTLLIRRESRLRESYRYWVLGGVALGATVLLVKLSNESRAISGFVN